jgi:hypothetical protein
MYSNNPNSAYEYESDRRETPPQQKAVRAGLVEAWYAFSINC